MGQGTPKDPNLIPENIKLGVSIYDVIGSFGGNFASGIYTTPSTSVTFTAYAKSSNALVAYNNRPVTITGLTFKPRMILLYRTDSVPKAFTIYSEDVLFNNNPASARVFANASSECYYVSLDQYAYVTDSAFRLPSGVTSTGTSITWIALG